MEEGPLDVALRIVNGNAERIERQERLAFLLDEVQSPLAAEARHLLEMMRNIQRFAVKRLIDAEDQFGRT